MRVLIVEDERKISAYVKRGLAEQGYAVDVAFTGREALDWAETVTFDLIVLDIMLPEIDGVSVCRELRQRGVRAPVLMLTARDTVDDRVAGLDAGADDYLVKPFALKELLARLRALTRRAADVPKSPVLEIADLAPIDHITRTTQRIASGTELSARLNLPPTEDEVGRLAITLDAMLARLDEAFRRERQFTADASHELRTPLAAMQAILSVIRTERRTPEDYEQALADLSEETDRLRSLVEDSLRLARGDGQHRNPPEQVNLSTLLGDVTDSLRPLAEAKGLTLTSATPAGLSLTGDSDSLIRLFVNLLDNAMKYTEHGTITVGACADNGVLRVTVTDTGCGIPAEHLPRIIASQMRSLLN